jgi:hypothetical protein
MVDEKPCSYAFAEYFKKLWLPTPVATMDMVISHHENLRPLKKKSWVVLLYRAKKDPNPKTIAK